MSMLNSKDSLGDFAEERTTELQERRFPCHYTPLDLMIGCCVTVAFSNGQIFPSRRPSIYRLVELVIYSLSVESSGE